MPKQTQVAGHEARVRARRQGDEYSALLCRLKRSEGGIERLANEFTAEVPKLEFSPAEIFIIPFGILAVT
jgi:hypothetical protein